MLSVCPNFYRRNAIKTRLLINLKEIKSNFYKQIFYSVHRIENQKFMKFTRGLPVDVNVSELRGILIKTPLMFKCYFARVVLNVYCKQSLPNRITLMRFLSIGGHKSLKNTTMHFVWYFVFLILSIVGGIYLKSHYYREMKRIVSLKQLNRQIQSLQRKHGDLVSLHLSH